MNGRAQLVALWIIAVLASIVLGVKGRGLPPTSGSSAVFCLGRSNGIRVKVTGIQGRAGVYCMEEGAVLGSVINMATQGFMIMPAVLTDPARRLKDGEWVEFEATEPEPARISLKMMPVAERMLLGIPLDLSTMTESDWERLPGIGPALARKIILDRQCNGGFRSIQDLERISGIGKVTVSKVESYF
ncbi:MAG: helix-hairpin-helix domain-containing protein [Deltaproteobacteria bacterium]|nr:helix-hairpin-helix domain-containing protein [Deltaproteobacteria bacterium]